MNAKKREKLREVVSNLDRIAIIVESVYDNEEDCLSNYPENLQETEQYEKMEDAVDALWEALCNIEDAKDGIESAIR